MFPDLALPGTYWYDAAYPKAISRAAFSSQLLKSSFAAGSLMADG
jgi:hypothetical protein